MNIKILNFRPVVIVGLICIGGASAFEHTRMVNKPEDHEVRAGTTATFRCSAVTNPTLNLTIDWLRNGDQIDFDSEERYIRLQDFSLTINKTTELDSGVYTCVARTKYVNATASATLTVLSKTQLPIWTIWNFWLPQVVPNRPNLTGVICGRRDAKIMWKDMGDNRSPILHYTIQYNTSFTPDNWEIASKDVPATQKSYTMSLSPWANYTFRVIAINKIGASHPSIHSDVCNTPPDVPFKNPDNVEGYETANKLVISWTPMSEIDHNAPKFKYQIQWKPNDEKSPWISQEVTDWRQKYLVIENQATCPCLIRVGAINEIGESSITPTDVPGSSEQQIPLEAPGNFTLVDIMDAHTAFVSWYPVNPDSLRGKFEGYKILIWTDYDSDDDKREIFVRKDATRVVVDRLIPYTKNYVILLAYNTNHDGPASKAMEIMTPQGTPGPVESFNAYPMGVNSLYLTWTKPEQPNGILTGYNIYYQKVTGTEVGPMVRRNPFITDPNRLNAKLGGLEAGTKYRLHIMATTEVGEGDQVFIEESTFRTPPAVVHNPIFRWAW